MDRKIRVGAVSYFNTKPLIYGFEQWLLKDQVELLFDYPSNIAKALLHDEIDLGLVPVAIIPELDEYHIISDYCIGSDGAVSSVCIFSEVPIGQVKTVLLDYQSRTSVALAKILLKEFWKATPEYKNAGDHFLQEIKDTTAAVVIGDRALALGQTYPYVYDLGLAWKQYTGLPFVFAAWVSNKELPEDFISDFNRANALGLEHLDEVIQKIQFTDVDLHAYYTQFISYNLDAPKRKGLNLFLEHLQDSCLKKLTI